MRGWSKRQPAGTGDRSPTDFGVIAGGVAHLGNVRAGRSPMPQNDHMTPRRTLGEEGFTPNRKADFVELGITTCFSFLRGASDAVDLAATAWAQGYDAIGVADLNTMAGVVRIHGEALRAQMRPVIGCRIELVTGAAFLAYPRDRQAYGRLCTLLSKGKMSTPDGGWQEKGICQITLRDLAQHADGTQLIALPGEDLDRFEANLKRLIGALPTLRHIAASYLYRGDDRARINRLDTLARFETNPRDEKWMKSMAQQTLLVAREIEKSLELVVEGLEGGVEPLANVGGDEPKRRGAFVKVSAGGKIAIEELNRVTFENHQPPPDRPRTKRGSLRELFSAQKQYQTSAAMLGRYDPVWRKNKGHVQVVVPAAYPAIYLNEIVRGSIEAKMKFLHVMTMSKRGELRELVLRLDKPKKKKRKKPFKEVLCKDEISMQDCARRIKHALGQGSALFVVD